MSTAQPDAPTTDRPLRLWPGFLIVTLQWLVWFVLPLFVPNAGAVGAIGALVGGLAVVIWWVFFSRVPHSERWLAVGLIVVALAAVPRLLHVSIATGGMGMVFYLYALPVLSLGLVLWAAASRRLAVRPRRAALVATIFVSCGLWALLRTAGVAGDGNWDFSWRWATTPEQQLLAHASDEPSAQPPAPAGATRSAGWPGFRGPGRNSVISGVHIDTDWSTSPPVELWRRSIGPGWSSFAVHGDLIYTQEQRGDDEVVACYNAVTGEPVWQHRDRERFWEAQAGAGPRATPTLHGGRVYTFGATGILNALDASDGTLLWSRNAASDTGVEIPGWGFSSSPLVVDDLVIVHAGALAAYDLTSGEPRWFGPVAGSYSSPQLVTIDGVRQIVMLSGDGTTSVAVTGGTLLWQHPWPGGIVQPAVTANGDLLLSAGGLTGGLGVRRVAVAHSTSGWTTEERWTSNRLKPNFNDFVVHQGHAYGFDGSILACIELAAGERSWKGGRYGNGQLVLLADQDLLLVLSEKGELALVRATPDRFSELARFPAIEGKTWNHPVLVGDLLLVRNGEQMVAFRLSLTGLEASLSQRELDLQAQATHQVEGVALLDDTRS